ncbi:phosphoglycerate mutase-like protein 1 isoform X3 [Papaver somniferum]|uniref:phosphoglycerate mutase-like protein 1 isoform X3 n=1 Tax=Papaver somniferum TaxID=3469 RepID=UPI000E6F5BB0|nr:phosphoglycerate mutase-like protein 1 isoform X3 [Papaver somniferum]
MDSSATTTLFPLHRTKILHLVRHAQGVHNVEGEKDFSAYKSEEFFDAQLTPLGWEQVDNLHEHIHECGLDKKVELVVVSPLLRTLQTAVGAFGATTLMVANAGNSNRSAISSLNIPPFVAVELCREQLIKDEEDVLWEADVRESKEAVATRGMEFINWLWTRKEKEIAVVTHRAFLRQTLAELGDDCHITVQKEIRKPFANCELRSVVIIDRGLIGSDTSVTNYPGKIPIGLDLPSDAALDKHPAEQGAPNS